MNYKLNLRTQNMKLTLFFSLIFCAIFISCGQNSKKQSSELIKKINAVQQQIMAQGNVTKEEDRALLGLCNIISHNDGMANINRDNLMILKDVDFVPVYEGCEGLSKEETKTCFSNKISTFIKREFNLELSKELNLSEPKEVEAFFVINESGNLTTMKVRNADITIQGEILRVLRKIPIMNPALHNGKKISALCSIAVKYGNDIDINVVYVPEFPEE